MIKKAELYFVVCEQCKTIITSCDTEKGAENFVNAMREVNESVYCGYVKCVKSKHDEFYLAPFRYDHFKDDRGIKTEQKQENKNVEETFK